MSRFIDSVRTLALALGAPGLILVAFLDSSFLPLPGHHRRAAGRDGDPTSRRGCSGYVAATVGGSIAGCLVLHYLGKKGGEALVRQRFGGEKVEGALATLQRYGVDGGPGPVLFCRRLRRSRFSCCWRAWSASAPRG